MIISTESKKGRRTTHGVLPGFYPSVKLELVKPSSSRTSHCKMQPEP